MKKFLKKLLLLTVASAIAAAALPVVSASAYKAPVDTVRIGLNYGSSALAAANLQNYSGRGSGYEFGYFDSERHFVSLGGYTSEEKITMMIDKNMTYVSGNYKEGTGGDTVVGCFHIKLDGSYSSYSEALDAASTVSSSKAFVRYYSGAFYAMVGNYTSQELAVADATALGVVSYTIDSGTSHTVAVVKTGTSKVLFEFDGGTSSYLGIMPRRDGGGLSVQTWFKGYRWYGGFQYARLSSGALTVVNFVNIEDYVKGVIPYEMNASWPVEALKAQAICARTYIIANLNKHKSYGFDCCNSTDCQVYFGCAGANANSDTAVESTAGQFLMYGNELCITYYFAADGGWTENSENVWSNYSPYLRAVEDVYETAIADSIPGYNWTRTYTGDQLAQRLQNRGYSCSTIVKFEILEFTDAGNVYKIRLTDSNGKTFTFSKEACRTIPGAGSQRYNVSSEDTTSTGTNTTGSQLYVNSSTGTLPQPVESSYAIGSGGVASGLPAQAFAITGTGTLETVSGGGAQVSGGSTSATGSVFYLTGTGSGHNVGMSQRGAYAMAKEFGKTCNEILTFYFQGTSIVTSE
ncbi:MAG: SpoIID/LytB domain-containing protein [Oscillospiraceae bacterium]|nr:SpoIID/LytB domain-containing protein [Oscillospiraceae bacterium]